jgi:hypothetical protein
MKTTIPRALILCAYLLCVISCTNSKEVVESTGLPEINVIKGITNSVNELLMSDAVQRIQVVPLQTNAQSLLGDFGDIQVASDDIFVYAYRNNKVLRFSKDGTFLNSIGEIGQGPSEYIHFGFFFTDDKEKEVGIASAFSVQMHRYDGNHIRTATRWNLDTNSYIAIDRCIKYMDDYYLAVDGPISRAKNNVKDFVRDSLWALARVDSNFTIQQRYYNPETLGREEELLKNRAEPDTWNWVNYYEVEHTAVDFYNNEFTVRYFGVDTLYRMKSPGKGFVPAYFLQLGERPSYELSHQWIKEKSFFDYLWITNFYEAKDYLYFTAYKSTNIYNIRYDKHTGDIESTRRKGELTERQFGPFTFRRIKSTPFILKNDICGGGDFKVDYKCGGKYWVSVIDPEEASKIDIEALKRESVKDEAAKQQLIQVLENVKEDDNPILLIATLK